MDADDESTPPKPKESLGRKRKLLHQQTKRSLRREVAKELFSDSSFSQICPVVPNITPSLDTESGISASQGHFLSDETSISKNDENTGTEHYDESMVENSRASNTTSAACDSVAHLGSSGDVQAEVPIPADIGPITDHDLQSMSFSDLMTLIGEYPDIEINVFDLIQAADSSYFPREEFVPESLFMNDVCCSSEGSSQSELNRILQQFEDGDEDDETDYDEMFLEDRILHKEVASTLREWALTEKIDQSKMNRLLQNLKKIPELSELPSTARGLASTRASPKPVDVPGGGQYLHFGMEKCLSRILRGQKGRHVELYINTNGVNIFKSKTSELWPILARIRNIKSLSHIVFPVGFYFDDHKPKKPDYLKYFVDELEKLVKDGFDVDGEHFTIGVKGVICDAPAKAVALGIMHCNGKNSCTRCHVKGEWSEQSKRVYFNDDNAAAGNHLEFLSRSDESFHHYETPLARITSLQFPQSISLDYLHLILLGVCRTTVYLWLLGKRPHRMPPGGRAELFEHSKKLARFAPYEFTRRPRSYEEVGFFKGTEWRQILCYHGMVIFNYQRIPTEKFKHFLCLVVAVRIMLDEKMIQEAYWLKYARDLLRYFVQKFRSEYDKDFITHNFHNLLHICDDIEFFGSIEDVSAFAFENFMQFILKLIKKTSGVLQQLGRRLDELWKHDLLFKQKPRKSFENPTFSKPNIGGPVTDQVCNPKYQSLKYKFFEVTVNKEGNNCCTITEEVPATDGSVTKRKKVVIIENICKERSSSRMMVVGRCFVSQEKYFDHPLDSSILGIYKVSSLSSTLKAWPIDNLICKNYIIPAKVSSVNVSKHPMIVVPLLNADFNFNFQN